MTEVLEVPFATSNSLNKQIFIIRPYNEKDTIILRSHEIKINSVFYSLMSSVFQCVAILCTSHNSVSFCEGICPVFLR